MAEIDDFVDNLSLDLKHSFQETDSLLERFQEFEYSSFDDDERDGCADIDRKEIDSASSNPYFDDDEGADEEMEDEINSLGTSIASLRNDLDMSVLLVSRLIQNQNARSKPLIALLDKGCTITMIHQRALPRGATPKLLTKPREGKSVLGTFKTRRKVYMQDIVLPQFAHIDSIEFQVAYVFDGDCSCDIIVGRDFLFSIYREQFLQRKKQAFK